MTEIEKLHTGWIDSSNIDKKEAFLGALNSYLLFKKDSIDKCDLLIENNSEFNAPKLLKTILILLSIDKHKISIANTLFKKINEEDVNDHFKEYLIIISSWLRGDLHDWKLPKTISSS